MLRVACRFSGLRAMVMSMAFCFAGQVLAQAVPGVTGGTAAGSSQAPDRFVTIHNDFNWVDDHGERILTRSGMLAQFNGVYYWYGGNPRGFREQHCYSSTDLIHWQHRGVILRTDVETNRIDVLYNDRTKQYVMFMKFDGNNAELGIATADRPEGPFTFKGSMRIDGARIGDMSMFKDEDGAAYLCYVSWAKGPNAQHGIYRMSADYMRPEKRMFLWDRGGREAPHLFKHNGTYFYGTSKTAWIDSSGTEYYTAKNLAGPWTKPRPLVTPGSDNSWDSQVDFVFPIQGRRGTVFLFAGDRWLKEPKEGRNGSYVWLPIEWHDDGPNDWPTVNDRQDWDLNIAAGVWRPFDASRNLAAGKPAMASSEVGENTTARATDVPPLREYQRSFWESDASDPQWIRIDLGKVVEFNRAILKWNMAAGAAFKIQSSVDGTTWADVYATDQGSANTVTDVTFAPVRGRYVRMYGTARAPVQVDTRHRVPGNPAAATRPTTRPSAPPPPGRYSLFDFQVFKD